MRKQPLVLCLATAAVIAALGGPGAAQGTNPRFGNCKLKSDAPAPAINILSYEAYNQKGMKINIDSVNRDGNKSQWWHPTMFDRKDSPVTGTAGSDTAAVTVINDRINEIVYKKGGKVTQILTNVLSPDGSVIGVMYMRPGESGTTINFATYERMK